jgi:K+-transporting ATPase A subunit
MRRPSAAELTVPVVAVAGGIVYLVAGLIGGQSRFGVAGLVVMVVFAGVLLLVRRRSETVKGLLDRRDERINTIDLRATALAGGVVLAALFVAFAVSIARGGSGAPYDWLLGLGGLAYLVSVVVMRLRG